MSLDFSPLPYTKMPTRMNKHQSGMILIVGLIMVLLLTIIGLAAVRGSGLQESMAANMRDINVAFQASESALRVCEKDIAPDKSLPAPQCLETTDLNLTPAKSIINSENDWLDLAKTQPFTVINIPNVSSQPNGLREKLNFDRLSYGALHGASLGMQSSRNQIDYKIYRVTVKGVGAADTTQIQLQTTYIR